MAVIETAIGVACAQTLDLLTDLGNRMATWEAARAAADAAGKPMLNIGCPSVRPLAYACPDVCLDISAERLARCRSARPTHGDVRRIPFPNKAFGSVICFHVLEHLDTVADAERALGELGRVADRVYVISPNRLQIPAWVHPEHRLWVHHHANGSISFEQR